MEREIRNGIIYWLVMVTIVGVIFSIVLLKPESDRIIFWLPEGTTEITFLEIDGGGGVFIDEKTIKPISFEEYKALKLSDSQLLIEVWPSRIKFYYVGSEKKDNLITNYYTTQEFKLYFQIWEDIKLVKEEPIIEYVTRLDWIRIAGCALFNNLVIAVTTLVIIKIHRKAAKRNKAG